jgi:Apoptosis regulator proteins, Bcl-2 family
MLPQPFSSTVTSHLVHRLIQEIALKVRTTVPMSNSMQEAYINLKRIVVEQLDKNESTFAEMYEMLDLPTDQNKFQKEGRAILARKTLQKIADSMDADGCANWGRVITLISFCCQVVKLNNHENDHCDQFNDIVEFLVQYLDNEISNLGGWDTLSIAFPENPNVKMHIWKGLVGSLIGLAIWTLFTTQ